MYRKPLVMAMATLMLAPVSHAYEPNFDSRQLGMGGTGVAASLAEGAAVANPALLTESHHDGENRGSFNLARASARASFDENFYDEVEDTQDTLGDFELVTRDFLQAVENEDQQRAQDRLEDLQLVSDVLIDEFNQLDNQGLRTRVNGSIFSTSSPGSQWGYAVTTGVNLYTFGDGDIDDRDLEILQVIRDADTNDPQQAIEDAEQAIGDIYDTDTGTIDNLASSGRATAGVVAEGKFSLSRGFDLSGEGLGIAGVPINHASVAITPKYQALITYDIVADLRSFDDGELLDDSDAKTDEAGINFNAAGAATLGENDQWRVGVMVRDLINRDLETNPQSPLVEPRTLKVGPQVSTGIAWRQPSYTLSADLDLTEREGFEDDADQQYLSVGGEYNLANWVRVRGGARVNLASETGPDAIEEKRHYTAGLELSPGPVVLQSSVLVGSENTVGASMDLGLRF